MKNNSQIFWQGVAGSWLALGLVGALTEIWRPGWFDFLIPVWLILSVAGVAGLISLVVKK